MTKYHIGILLLLLTTLTSWGQSFPFRYYAPIASSPSEDTHCVFFDKDGMMWVGTNAGVKSYDGYVFKSYRSDAYSPDILPNNSVYAITEDNNDNLWLGTRNGLVRMNKRTGVFKTFHLPKEYQRIIYTLYTSKDGTVWIGNDGGLTCFIPETETLYTYDGSNSTLIDESGKKMPLPAYSTKSIVEDRNGDILVGTWSSGLMRFRRGTNTFRRYPPINKRNSAYSLYLDRQHRLWIGTWGFGIVRMDDPDNVTNPQMHQYPYAPNDFDTFYKILEDPMTNTLWACTREGICTLELNLPDADWKKYTQVGNTPLLFCKSMAKDKLGNMWIATQNFGLVQVCTQPSPFNNYFLGYHPNKPSLNYIDAIHTDDGKTFWLGLNPYGVALYDRTTGNTLYNRDIPDLKTIPEKTFTTSISSITRRFNGELWFAVNNYGIIISKPDHTAQMLDSEKVPYIYDNFVNTIFAAKDGTMWIGQRGALSLVYPDNRGFALHMREGKEDLTVADVRGILQDKQGTFWIATDNFGIIRITGDAAKRETLKYHQYCKRNGKFAVNDAINCLEDREGRLWAISNSGGLFLYDKKQDCFVPKNRDFLLHGDRMLSINEDSHGHLWLTTSSALVRIANLQAETPEVTYYTKEDGLGDVLFAANSTERFGKEFFFSNRTGFFSFVPDNVLENYIKQTLHLVVTDILIDDVPFSLLSVEDRKAISTTTPTYANRITIPSSVRKFAVEFSLLTYGNTKKNIYAYKLVGYDKDWQYCGTDVHRAFFQNLPDGNYKLHLKANDGYGHWHTLPYVIHIRVLPPWYASWWAYLIYLALLIATVYAIIKWYKSFLKTKNRLQMGVILTNITHELLTPLTVISASVYKMREQAPQYEEDYSLIQNNISRTTRLLRQILEVRKSQAGQLKLLVSKGNLTSFFQMECENIRPMTIHSNISLTTHIPQGEIHAWYDPDKLDKILYNLLSNAIKYNKENGSVSVSLMATKEFATIMVTDTGIGMSKDKLKHLYTRFLDGDYRKSKVTGTGIGMSLTHDLVKLHHGHIECQSVEGEGTTFTVTFPIRKNDYAASEIDMGNKNATEKELIKTFSEQEQKTESGITGMSFGTSSPRQDISKLLLVEDNEELLELMKRVLGKRYQILTAHNGKQALNIIQKEELDLVVSDVMMPVMDGIELTQKIKEDKNYWQLPVILLTAKNRDEDKNEGYATGADAYLTKPFKLEDLEIRISTLIANRKKIREKFVKSEPSELTEETKHYSNPEQVFIMKATEFVKAHLDDPDYDRDSFAQDMTMSSSSLYNKIKAATGKTIVEFILYIRLQEACRILKEEPDILITELALRVGFNTPKYFSRCFKKEYGMGVKEFRQTLLQG